MPTVTSIALSSHSSLLFLPLSLHPSFHFCRSFHAHLRHLNCFLKVSSLSCCFSQHVPAFLLKVPASFFLFSGYIYLYNPRWLVDGPVIVNLRAHKALASCYRLALLVDFCHDSFCPNLIALLAHSGQKEPHLLNLLALSLISLPPSG